MLEVVGRVVVVVLVVPLTTWLWKSSTALIVDCAGLNSLVPDGTKPIVMSERAVILNAPGFPVSTVPEVVTTFGQVSTVITPFLPASGVPAGHAWPAL